MSNPFNTMNPIQNAYQVLTTAKNPMQAFYQIAQQNPNLQPIVNLLNNGANPQQLFVSMCQQRGINPNEFIRNITRR